MTEAKKKRKQNPAFAFFMFKSIIMARRLVFLSLFLICCSTAVWAQDIDETWLKNHYTKSEHRIPMRDGTRLFTVVYAPRELSGNHPILISRTPYSCSPYGADRYHGQLWRSHWREYVRAGYIIVYQDVRGRWMSEGEFVDLRPFQPKKESGEVDEASDAYDTVEWLLAHIPGNNGKVGVLGCSYSGFYTVMAALCRHPAIVAVNPQAPAIEWFIGDDFHHNGALMLSDAFRFYSSFGLPRPKPTTIGRPAPQYRITDEYSFFLNTGAVKNFTALLGDSNRFWQQMMVHPDRDCFWQSRDLRPFCRDIRPAVLITGGLFDAEDWYGTVGIAKAIAQQSPETVLKLVFGPWSHGGWNSSEGTWLGNVRFGSPTSEYYRKQIEIPFFNYYLKGEGSLSTMAGATVFFTGTDTWHTFECWPPKDVCVEKLYLQSGGTLSFRAPIVEDSRTVYRSDPFRPVPYIDRICASRVKEYMTGDQRFASRRPDVAVFVTEPLTEDLTLSGTVGVHLETAITTTDADFVVKLIDCFPEGFKYEESVYGKGDGENYMMSDYQMLVRGEVMRGRYRDGFDCPKAFVPNRPECVRFDLPDVAHVFRKGHRLMIHVQSSWFPLVDRNPQQFVDIYHCNDDEFIVSDITLFHQRDRASYIVLPVLKETF